jgi:hypothetical protein
MMMGKKRESDALTCVRSAAVARRARASAGGWRVGTFQQRERARAAISFT